MNKTNKIGCLVLVVLLALLGGIYYYLGDRTSETTPSPSKGSLPPPSAPGSAPPQGKQPMRPLPSDPPG